MPKREQRYFGLVRPDPDSKAGRYLLETEARLIEELGCFAISYLKLSRPTLNSLVAGGFTDIREIVRIFKEGQAGVLYLRCPQFGPKKMKELKRQLDAFCQSQRNQVSDLRSQQTDTPEDWWGSMLEQEE